MTVAAATANARPSVIPAVISRPASFRTMKRKAIEQARPPDHATIALASWRTDASVLKWLETL